MAKRRPPLNSMGDPTRHLVRSDMRRPHDVAPGTAPSRLGEVKRESEEARLVPCPECGYHNGRHSVRCARAPAQEPERFVIFDRETGAFVPYQP